MGKIFQGVILTLAGLGFVGYLSDQKSSGTGERASATPKAEALKNIRLSNLNFRKDGFGTIMMLNVVVRNDNDFPVKDIEITCNHFANSGSKIDSNTRTIYERVEAKGSYKASDFNMGFMHDQARSTECSATNFGKI